jgi:hypothetical protein
MFKKPYIFSNKNYKNNEINGDLEASKKILQFIYWAKLYTELKQLKLTSLIWAKHVGEWRKMGNKITNLEQVNVFDNLPC